MTNCTKVASKTSSTKRERRGTALLAKQMPTMGEAVVRVGMILNGEIKQPRTMVQNAAYILFSETTGRLYVGKGKNIKTRINQHKYHDFKDIPYDGMLLCSCPRIWDTKFILAVEERFIQAAQIYAAMFGYTVTNKNKIYKGDLNDLLKPSDLVTINTWIESHKVA